MSLPSIKTFYEHIELDEKGIPIILGTNMKVVELVLGKISHGWSPEEMRFQHPYLTMGQIHSALAYYWDHQEELEKDIERRLQLVKKMQKETGTSPLVIRLKSKGLL